MAERELPSHVTNRPVAFVGEGFEIVAHESPAIRYPEESHATVQICIPMLGARCKVTRESETGAALKHDFSVRRRWTCRA